MRHRLCVMRCVLFGGYMLTFPPPQHSCILRASEPAGIVSPSVKLTKLACPVVASPRTQPGFRARRTHIDPRTQNGVLIVGGIGPRSSDPVNVTPRPTGLFPRHHLRCIARPSSCSSRKTGHNGRCSQDRNTARSNFRLSAAKSSTTLVFGPPRFQTPPQDQTPT